MEPVVDPVFASAGLAVFALGLLAAAIGDVRTFMITNRLNFAIAAAFLALALPMGLGPDVMAAHLWTGIAAFVIGMAGFLLGVFGGGDAKLGAAAALWLGPGAIMAFLLNTALAGGILALILIAGRQAARRWGLPKGPRWMRRILRRRAGVPYGVALGAGALLAAPAAAWFPHAA